ncbi:MAG TPA: sodium-dependent transporter [Parachlamydiaceae bacterium]|nr:sodium-dependent transporter [Parachlamydiaceae bacterium]
MKRDTWGSKIGFIFAVAGSAIGLANIWRFPFLVGQNGGAAFIFLYLACLFLIGFPTFIAELLIGRTTAKNPSAAFEELGKSKKWGFFGKVTIVTGFLVSSFYSAVAGWILGYLVEAIRGNTSNFTAPEHAASHYNLLMSNPFWGVAFHFLFISLCIAVLYFGVRNGIEKGNKIMMPLLFIVLFALVFSGLMMKEARLGLQFLFSPDFSLITPTAVLIALGQSFFTLSIGQGTLVTYGSYLESKENLVATSLPIIFMDTLVSILSAVAVFTIVFSAGLEPNSGPGLIFHTLPFAFSQMTGGHLLAVLFFLLVTLAALTSEISALEPSIAYFIDEWGLKREKAVALCGFFAFLLGVPSALSYSVLKDYTLFGFTFLDGMDFLASAFLIPLGGFLAVVLTGWVWGFSSSFKALSHGAEKMFKTNPWLKSYFWFSLKFAAPVFILLVFLNLLGLF